MEKKTAVEWLEDVYNKQGRILPTQFEQAKAMENQKDNIIGEIDDELAMLEDYTHGKVGDIITNLRYKIQQYYGK